jgi:hypothetical protein
VWGKQFVAAGGQASKVLHVQKLLIIRLIKVDINVYSSWVQYTLATIEVAVKDGSKRCPYDAPTKDPAQKRAN